MGVVLGRFAPNSPIEKCILLGTSLAVDIAPHGILTKASGI